MLELSRLSLKMKSSKSVRWSAVPVAPVSVCGCVMVRGAAALKGPMTYDLCHFGGFMLGLELRGCSLSLEIGIGAMWLDI